MSRIDLLPDDALLEIFHFYLSARYKIKTGTEAWQTLTHVCRRWRNLVLGSPRQLDLQLYCTPQTPARDTLDVWPAFPLLIRGSMTSSMAISSTGMVENVIAALGRSDAVREVILWDLASLQLEKLLAPMQASFPALTHLQLLSKDEIPVIPDSFLGGSAPRLRFIYLHSISFPGLPKLLLSATQLVHLQLDCIPHSGYISPEAIAAALPVLPSLGSLSLDFQSPQSHPDQGSLSLPPLRRSVLPALRGFRFKGTTEFLEELVTGIATPLLDRMEITFFNQMNFDCPRLAQFINNTPALRARDEAHVQIGDRTGYVTLRSRTSKECLDGLRVNMSCRASDTQLSLSSVSQICNTHPHPLYTVEDLYIEHNWPRIWKNDVIEAGLWLELLLPFTAVKYLSLHKEFAPGIAAALRELVGSRIMDVLPNLQEIFMEALKLSESFQEAIGEFVAARRLLGRPIVISVRVKDRT